MSRPGTTPGAAGAGAVTPEVRAQLVELLSSAASMRDICACLGLRLDTVRREAAPFLAIMKLTGTHPKCGCGKDRFHPYGCVDSYAKGNRGSPEARFPGHTHARAVVLAERRKLILAELIDGERFFLIDRKLGLYPKSARKYLRFLTPGQLAQRANRVAERAGAANERKAA